MTIFQDADVYGAFFDMVKKIQKSRYPLHKFSKKLFELLNKVKNLQHKSKILWIQKIIAMAHLNNKIFILDPSIHRVRISVFLVKPKNLKFLLFYWGAKI